MSQELDCFVRDYILILQEKYNDSLTQSQEFGSEVDNAFQKGVAFAYYDALDLIQSQLEAFGYDIETISKTLPEFGRRM